MMRVFEAIGVMASTGVLFGLFWLMCWICSLISIRQVTRDLRPPHRDHLLSAVAGFFWAVVGHRRRDARSAHCAACREELTPNYANMLFLKKGAQMITRIINLSGSRFGRWTVLHRGSMKN